MIENAIKHSTLAKLVESGSVRGAHVIGLAGGWGISVKCGGSVKPLAAQRGKVRLFSRLETAAAYLKGIGIARFDVDVLGYAPQPARRARPDRATSLKRAHAAAAYDTWFRSQVQAALDDPRPGVPHEEVLARWRRKRSRLLKNVKAARAAKA